MLDRCIQELMDLTLQCAKRLPSADYEEMAEFVNRREQILQKIQSIAVTDHDKEKYRPEIERILSYDEAIVAKLHALKNEAAESVQKIHTGRKQKQTYDTQYNMDGIFFDKRK